VDHSPSYLWNSATWENSLALIPFLRPVLDRTRLVSPHAEVTIRAAALGQDSSLLGAAELAFAPLLADPQGVLGGDVVASG